MGSACDVLRDNPRRFIDYVMSNQKVRNDIVDEESMRTALETVLKSDPSLTNILKGLAKDGDSLEKCSVKITQHEDIKSLTNRNIRSRRKEIRKRVRRDRPALKGKEFRKEVKRRLNISIGVRKSKVKTIQLTIDQAKKPVKIRSYSRRGKTVKRYSRSESRDFTKAETDLLKNNIHKTPSVIIKKYYDAGLTFRTKTSLRRKIYRLRKD